MKIRELELRFIPCAICKSKPGSPQLCESCLNNRAVIERLEQAVSVVDRIMVDLSQLTSPGKLRDLLSYPPRCICKKPWFENPECKVHGR